MHYLVTISHGAATLFGEQYVVKCYLLEKLHIGIYKYSILKSQ